MKQSNNYDEFQLVANRPISAKHVQKLVKANEKKFLLDCYPIIVDAQKRIFDGQHRYMASRQLGTPVYYVEKDIVINENTLLTVNSLAKSHSTKDKINICLSYNDEQMKKAQDIWAHEPRIPMEIAVELLGCWTAGGTLKALLDSRKYYVKYEADYLGLLEYLQKLDFDPAFKYKGIFVHAVAFFYRHKKPYLIKLLGKTEFLQAETSRPAYKQLIEFLCETD